MTPSKTLRSSADRAEIGSPFCGRSRPTNTRIDVAVVATPYGDEMRIKHRVLDRSSSRLGKTYVYHGVACPLPQSLWLATGYHGLRSSRVRSPSVALIRP